MRETGKAHAFTGQIIRFIVTGIGATLIDLAVLNALMYFFPLGPAVFGMGTYLGWKTVSFLTASIYSYFTNKHFTFQAHQASTPREVSKFAMVALTGFYVNVLIPTTLFGAFSGLAFLSPFVRANAASVAGTALSLMVNFFGYKYFVFKK